MKAWEEVTERERGWIEGVFAAGREFAQDGVMRSLSVSRTYPDTPRKLSELLGGTVQHRRKKLAYEHHTISGPLAGTIHHIDDAYCYEWIAKGPDFQIAMKRLADLDLPWGRR